MERPVSQIWQIKDSDTLNKIIALYSGHNIPIAFRFHCREIIEDQMPHVLPNSSGRIPLESSRDLFLRLQNGFNKVFSTLPNYEQHQLSWFHDQLNTKYNNNPDEFVNLVRNLHFAEKEDAISQQQSGDSNQADNVEMDITDREGNDSEREFDNRLSSFERTYELLSSSASDLKKEVKEFAIELGVFYIMLQSYGRNREAQIFTTLNELVEKFETSEIYKNLRDLLDYWEIEMRSRSLLVLPSESHDMVHHILKKLTKIAKLVQGILEDFKRCGNLMRHWNLFTSEDDCKKLFSNVEKLQVQLFFITCRFVHIGSNISEEYHNPIVHKVTRFPVSASIFSLPSLNQEITEIQVDFQNEVNAKSISSLVDNILAEQCPNALSNLVSGAALSVDRKTSGMIGKIDYHRFKPLMQYTVLDSAAEEGPLQYDLPRLELSGGRRRKGRLNLVTDDRYYLVVQFKFTYDEKEYHVWRVSSPIIIATHTSQDMNAWSTLFLNYGVHRSSMISVEESMSRTCEEVLENLCEFYYDFTGIRLGKYQRKHLTSILNRNNTESWTHKDIIGKDLSKDGRFTPEMKVGKFTLWEWFYKSAFLHKMFPEDIAQDIHGFIDKEDVEKLLKKKQNSTFLLKFSEKMPGELLCAFNSFGTIEYTLIPTDNGEKGEKKKNASKAMLRIAKYIKRAPELLYLYPNVNKRSLRFIEETYKHIRAGPEVHVFCQRPGRAPNKRLLFERSSNVMSGRRPVGSSEIDVTFDIVPRNGISRRLYSVIRYSSNNETSPNEPTYSKLTLIILLILTLIINRFFLWIMN